MKDESNTPNFYQHQFFGELFRRMDKQDESLKGIDNKITSTDGKVDIQNGKTSKLETWSNDAQKIIEANAISIGLLKSDRTRIYTIIIVGLFFIGTIGTLYYKLIDSKIENINKSLDGKIETALSNITIEGTLK